MTRNKIIVLGATGYTGKIICQQLEKKNIRFAAGARSLTKLEEMKFESIEQSIEFDILNEDHFDRISGFNIVINCIGPFNIYGRNFIKYLSDKNIVYLDITGEQSFLKYSLENCGDSTSLFVHSCSFESALVCMLTNILCDKEVEYESIDSFYGFSDARPSPGTRFTMKTHRYFDSFYVKNGVLCTAENGPDLKEISFPHWDAESVGCFTPYPEVLYNFRNFKVKNGASYTLLARPDAVMAQNIQRSKKSSENATAKPNFEKLIQKADKSNYTGPDSEDREKQKFFIGVQAIADETKKVSQIELSGLDMYGLTAALIVAAVEYFGKHEVDFQGVKCISEVWDSKTVLNELSESYQLSQHRA